MIVSLTAHAMAAIEVGQYGMSLEDAKEAFLKTVAEVGSHVKSIKQMKNGYKICLDMNCYEFLNMVADVADLHGDPPDTYTLKELSIPDGEYVKTGIYND